MNESTLSDYLKTIMYIALTRKIIALLKSQSSKRFSGLSNILWAGLWATEPTDFRSKQYIQAYSSVPAIVRFFLILSQGHT